MTSETLVGGGGGDKMTNGRTARIAILAAVAVSGCSPYLLGSPRNFDSEVRSSVGVVGTCGAGTGVILDGHTVLTASHVALSCELTELHVLGSAGSYAAYPEAAVATDIVRLHVDEDLVFGAVEVDRAKVGERLCGYTAFPDREWLCGTVTTANLGDSGVGFSGTVVRGNSGTGLYNSSGHLVAIVTRMDGHGHGLATQIPRWFAGSNQ